MLYSFVGKTDSAAMIDAELLRDIPLLCVAMFKCRMLGSVAGLTAQVSVAGRTRQVLGRCYAASAYGGRIIPQNRLAERLTRDVCGCPHHDHCRCSCSPDSTPVYLFFVSASGSNSFVIVGGQYA